MDCQTNCKCDYNQMYAANNMVCTQVPSTISGMANWLTITQGNLGHFCGNYPYLHQVWSLNLSNNGISEICEDIVEGIVEGNTIRWLDLSKNKIAAISQQIRNRNFEKVWLSGNEFVCNCDMLWMAEWLANTTSSSGHVIQDYREVLCHSGKYDGIPIYTLTAEKMDCLPTRLPVWGIGLIAGAGVLVISIVITVVLIARRWNDVKFLLYYHFNILNKNDDDLADVRDLQFDALLSYT